MHNTATSDGIILGLSVAVGVLLIRIRAGQVERRRIRAEIERGGGEVIRISRSAAGRRWSKELPLYDVVFRTPQGETVTATCRSGLAHGVEWTWSSPRAGEEGGEIEIVEATVCLACGGAIAAGRVRCPACGWTYG